jgi:Flp pilus assembly protein TadG
MIVNRPPLSGARSRFPRDTRGSAAVEFVLWVGVLALPLINVVDLSFYTYQRMQVETAAEAAVNAAWRDCNPAAATPAPPPAIVTCKAVVTTVVSDMQTAAHSTSLSTQAGLATADIVEGYYCPSSSGVTLVTAIGTAASPPTNAPARPNCAGTTTPAGDYIAATVRYTYSPLFANASILSILTPAVAKTAWMRLDN